MSSQARSSVYANESVPEVRQHSNDQLPEVSQVGAPYSTIHPYEDYEFYEQTSPAAPEYQQRSASPQLSSRRSPNATALGSDGTRSPAPIGEGMEPNGDLNRNSRALSPLNTYRHSDIGSAGLESVHEKEGQKEVYQSAYTVDAVPYQQPDDPSEQHRLHRKVCGIAMKWCLIFTALILVAIIAVAVALGVVFGTKHNNSSKTSTAPTPTANTTSTTTQSPTPTPTGDPNFVVGGAYDPAYYSKTGAFNGTGIALASVNFGVDDSIFVYFQHYTGELRAMVLQANGDWSDSNTVASDAKNGTPISIVAYVSQEVAQWHLFYINNQNIVMERISSNGSAYQENIWTDGPLTKLNLKALDADMAGLQACYWGDFYGDSDYNFGDGINATNITTTRTGINLWYADTKTSFKQWSWLDGQTDWSVTDYNWDNQNGQAGVGCYTWATGSTQYVFMVDLENNLQVYWKDSNSSNKTPSHPTNQWNIIDAVQIPGVHPSTTLSFTNYLVCQLNDMSIHGYNLTWQAENTTFAPAFGQDNGQYDEFIIQDAGETVYGLPGTHLVNTALSNSQGAYLTVFIQQEGTDITIYNRPDLSSGGLWTSTSAPVNN